MNKPLGGKIVVFLDIHFMILEKESPCPYNQGFYFFEKSYN
jgi:hypothetical protein